MTKNRQVLFIVVLCLLAFFLRVYKINTDLLFHRDQGLHALQIWNIWHEHKFSLLGHTSDVDGLIHAPIYFWLMTPIYAIFHGDPVSASIFQITLEVFSLPFLYLAIKKLFNAKTALLTIIFYATSYGLISYSRWQSNVTPIFPLTNLFIFFLAYYLSLPKLIFIFSLSLIAGLITQMNAAVGVFLLPFLLFLLTKKFSLLRLFLLLVGFMLPAIPLVIFELRHNFVILHAILGFGQSQTQTGFDFFKFTNNFQIYLTEIAKVLSYPYTLLSFLLLIWSTLGLKNYRDARYLYLLLAIPIVGLSFLHRGAISFFYVDLLAITLSIISFGINRLPSFAILPLVTLIIFLNLSQLPNIYQPTNALIPIGDANLITIQDRKNIFDWVYLQSRGESYSVWFYTLPYFQEEAWQYLLLWYIQPKYGYLPEYTGGFSPADLKSSKYFFAVWEPDPGNPSRFQSWQDEVTANFGSPISSYQSHDLYVAQYSTRI